LKRTIKEDNRKGHFFFVVRSVSEAHQMRSVSGAFIGGGGLNSLGHSERTFAKNIHFFGRVGGFKKIFPFEPYFKIFVWLVLGFHQSKEREEQSLHLWCFSKGMFKKQEATFIFLPV